MARVTVSDVWRHVPPEINTPDKVTVDGKGGVTQQTYDALVQYAEAQADIHLQSRYGLTLPAVIASEDVTLKLALSQLVAAYILRTLKAYQAISKDLFANAFATLDEWAEWKLEKSGSVVAPEFIDDTFTADFPKL